MDFAPELKRLVEKTERGLDQYLPPASTRPERLHAAMRYSLQAGGKRIRPVLLLAAAEIFASKDDSALPAAVAIECLHTYSLIHDDLPCMDNDDLRRGRPTAHKAFDEATALLAGDALLTHAFSLLSTYYAANSSIATALVRELADAASSRRLIGGQMEDLLAEKRTEVSPQDLEYIHLNKTAAMIQAALVMGGLIGEATEAELTALRSAGRHLGLTFQIVDDILDATADTATLGKTAGKDLKANKSTFVKLYGIERSREFARDHALAARAAIVSLPGDKAFLAGLIEAQATRAK